MNFAEIIELLNLEPHVEGGFYKETYHSQQLFGENSISTAIYYLLPKGEKSHFHRITSDEIWHFYLGGALEIVQISPEGDIKKIILGTDLTAGQVLQYCVPAHYWFGAEPCAQTDFTLVGCTVAPGFSFNNFELGNQQELLQLFPDAEKEILHFTRNY
jgi:predicted cupin superfamily sugar epimerase